jgi:hypothetical protein
MDGNEITQLPIAESILPKIGMAAGVALVITVLMALLMYFTHRPLAQHVPAAPYVWPSGCEPARASHDTSSPNYVRYYGPEDEIPRACLNSEYYIADPGKFGLQRHYGVGRNYYRIGPDAVNIDCFSDGRCVVTNIERDVFVDSDNSNEPVPAQFRETNKN